MQIASRVEKSLFDELKANNEDFEFYPTTTEILRAIVADKFYIQSGVNSILDIGCGNGKALDFFSKNWETKIDVFGIEKSQILISNLVNPDILILGNDFKDCMLLDKQVDMIFSNPPYKEFKEWTLKILSYSISKKVVLVIPERWRNDEQIAQCVKECGWQEHLVGRFDFFESEDRRARAKVEVIAFRRNTNAESVFERELEKSFGMGDLLGKVNKVYWERYSIREEAEEQCKDVVSAKELIDYLLNRYHADQRKLFGSLEALSKVGADLMSDLGVRKENIIKAVVEKIKFQKNIYWNEVIDRIPEISKRLSVEQKKGLLQNLAERGAEFTKSNILGVILFSINVAKKCEKENFVKYWEYLANREWRLKYKSNEKAFGDCHRYEKPDKMHEGKLDYRIIVSYAGTFYSTFDYLHDPKAILNLHPIARAMGYFGDIRICDENGEQVYPEYRGIVLPLGESFAKIGDTTIARLKVFKNNNLHIFFNQDFLAKLNLNVFTHLGWIKTKEEAKKEFKKEMSESEIEEFFNQQNKPLSLEF